MYQELGPPDRVTIKDLDVVCVMLGSADFRSSLTGSPDMNSAETVRQLGLIPDVGFHQINCFTESLAKRALLFTPFFDFFH